MAVVPPQPGSAALITGASSGIGLEFARELAARGHDLILAARREHLLEQAAREFREAYGRRVEVVATDVSEPEGRARLAASVRESGLAIDVLVLSAGFGMGGPLI